MHVDDLGRDPGGQVGTAGTRQPVERAEKEFTAKPSALWAAGTGLAREPWEMVRTTPRGSLPWGGKEAGDFFAICHHWRGAAGAVC